MTASQATTPFWALIMAYWLHMFATIVWVGGLAALVLLFLPAARHDMGDGDYANLLERIHRRLDTLGWFSLAVLLGTGLFQMSANPNYQGLLTIPNRWAAAILFKHMVFLSMVGVSAYLTWGLLPALRRATLLKVLGQGTPETERLHRRQVWLVRLNLLLGVLALGLTAVARAS